MMSKTFAALCVSGALLLPGTVLAEQAPPENPPPANHGQCVSTFNQTFEADPDKSASQNAQARNAARKQACPPPGQAKKAAPPEATN